MSIARALRSRLAYVAFTSLLAIGCGDDPATPATADTGAASDTGTASDTVTADTAVTTDTGALGDGAGGDAATETATDAGSFVLTSTAFAEGAPVPAKYTCDGANVSPALAWSGAPSATKSFVLVVDDPDAPGTTPFVHWVVFDLAGSTTAIAEGATVGTGGKNGFGTNVYGGPCPPAGKVHHYRFQLRALDIAPLGAAAGASRATVDGAASGHVLATTTLVGT